MGGNGNIYPSSGSATTADLGIMKSLSSMSSVAKRNLNNLALQFSSKHKQTGDGSTEAERDRLVIDEGVSKLDRYNLLLNILIFSLFFICVIISADFLS